MSTPCCPGMAFARRALLCLTFVAAGAWGASWLMQSPTHAAGEGAKKEERHLFEMRTYITHEGRLDALNKRFREHTTKLFAKHGMTNVGYWTPAEGDEAKNTLVYILSFPNREAREKSWKDFIADPEWKAAQKASEADGPIVKEVKVQFLNPTDYSEIK